MRVSGMAIGFIDVAASDDAAYNRWWDLVMGPENSALSEIAAARRYVAPTGLQRLRGPTVEKGFTPGRATYCHLYLFGADPVEAETAMHALGRRLAAERRDFGRGWARYQGPHRLRSAHVRKGMTMAREAIPWIGHRGLYVTIGVVEDESRLAAAETWLDEVHLPRVLECPGFLAALRLSPADPARAGRPIVLFYLDEEPASAIARLSEIAPELRETGRSNGPDDPVRVTFAGPYLPLPPLRSELWAGGPA